MEKARALAHDLRGGRKVTDSKFDRIFPGEVRKFSERHWTPVEVAIRAAELLSSSPKTRVLDVGSGCGKFCLVSALSVRGHFTGVEQRANLIEVARSSARLLGARRAHFIHGNMMDLDWNSFDSFYLFNPFYENQIKCIRMDRAVSFSQDRFNRYVGGVKRKLREARIGTRVVTYHGFGGDFPKEFRLEAQEEIGTDELMLWVKS